MAKTALKARPTKRTASINADTVKISVRLTRGIHTQAKIAAAQEGLDLMRWVEKGILARLEVK